MTERESRELSKRASEERASQDYSVLLSNLVDLVERARVGAVRSVNAILTSTYWLIGQRMVEHEQSGARRADYGEELVKQLSRDLKSRLGRGFSERNVWQMRQFYLAWPNPQTLSAVSDPGSILQTLSAESGPAPQFPLPWSHYVRLLSVSDPDARGFYEREAIQGGWSVRQLDRQIATLAYQRTQGTRALASRAEPLDANAHVRDPFVLEFLNLKDEYSETDLEDALIRSLEEFLLELGNDFTFVARQKRLRVGNTWYRVDLVFFHRGLRCLVIIDLKIGGFTHADAGQMNLYLNYAREHWTHAHENPPVGLILCSEKDAAVAHYALDNLSNQVLAREYQLVLPKEGELARRLSETRRLLLQSSREGDPSK
ncbi:MAG TPA: PDDEXK nuclease domain-containing protein [Bryobacteraceae bacterium]|nr:PDDEXK nuclease domain-containing protein [Bryobacteraceae bacterium]